eukprot:10763635-Alexandrium_andersonii.AAC.1
MAGETLKGAKQTALTPEGEIQSWAVLESPAESLVSPHWSSSLMSMTPLPFEGLPLPLPCPWRSRLLKWAARAWSSTPPR